MTNNFVTDKKRLISNFFSLSSVEMANYIFPLITLPYLVRVLGPEKYGLIAFAQAFAQYFVLLTDYGFNLSATRNISIHKNNVDKISVIFNSVMIIKFILLTISFIIISALIFLIPKFRPNWLLYYFSFGMAVGNVLFPVWFFQGMERMKFIAFLNLLAKFIFVAAIFLFIKAKSDYIYVPLITSLGYIVAGILSLYIAFKRFHIYCTIPALSNIGHELREGWHIFISTTAVSLYTTSNTFILGLLTNNSTVGYYSAAEKLISSGQRLFNPIAQSIYPYISKLVSDSKDRALLFIKKIIILFGGASFILSLAIFVLSGFVVEIILGSQFHESIAVLRILAFLPFVIFLSNIFAIQGLVNFNFSNVVSKIAIRGGVLNLILAPIFIYLFKQTGLAISVLIVESFITLQGAYYFNKLIVKGGRI